MFRALIPGIILSLVLTVFTASPAMAQLHIATVDFQRALNEVDEGVTAMARLEGMRDEKMKSIEKMRNNLVQMQNELANQSAILSESARQEKEQAFNQAQAEYQQVAMGAEQEMQSAYMKIVDEFIAKMREVATAIAQEKGYNLVLEATESGVVFSSGIDDVTDELIKRYNAAHSVK